MDGKIQMNLNDGINNLAENKPEIAIENLSEVLKLDSKIWVALYYRAIGYKLRGKFLNAKSDLIELISIKDDLPQAYLELAKVMILLKNEKEAESQLQNCVVNYPNYLSAFYLMGDLYLMIGQVEKAKTFYKSCEKIDKNFSLAKVKIGIIEMIETKSPEAGLPSFNAAIALDSLQGEALWYRVTINFKNKPEKSLRDINTLVRVRPDNLLFILQRGLILTELNRFEDAWKDFYKFITTANIDQKYFVGQQTNVDRRIDVQNAGYYLVSQVYGLNEKDRAIIKKSYCLMFAERNPEALEVIKQAGDLEKSALWQYLCGVINEHLKVHKVAWGHYENALRLDPEIFDAHQKRGIYRSNVGKWRAAEQDFTEMIRIQPASKFGYKLRGVARYRKKDYKKAIDDSKKVLQVDSTDCDARNILGNCLLKTNEYFSGIDELDRCKDYAGLFNLNLHDFHNSIKGLLISGDTTKTLRYLTIVAIHSADDEAVMLKMDILYHQKKWKELNAYLKETLNYFTPNLHSKDYIDYLNLKLKQMKEIMGSK